METSKKFNSDFGCDCAPELLEAMEEMGMGTGIR